MIRFPWTGRRPSSRGEGHSGHERHAQRPACAPAPGLVRGERGHTVASRARSLQSRLNGVLAVGLAIGVSLVMLGWYYAEALHRIGKPALSTETQPAAGGRTLPALGPVTFPHPAPVSQPARAAPRPAVAATPATPLLPVEPAMARAAQAGGASARLPQRRRALARRLSGAVFAGAEAGTSMPRAQAEPSVTVPAQHSTYSGYPARLARGGSGRETLSALLRPTTQPATRARLLPQQRLLLPKGAFIDCTLETAIDSTLPGMTTCITATDTFSADGTVVLLERGTELIGETRGQVRQGMARVFVIWTEARTPSGVVVQLDSPGTDALGRSGLTGRVNRHFWQRFGAALLVSTIDAGVQSSLQSGSGTVVINPTASEEVMTEALRGTVDIPPTITVPNGARIQVLVARDVDFRSVYELLPRS